MNNAPISPLVLAQGSHQPGLPGTLSAGLKIEGMVTAFDREGHALVRTSHGVLVLPGAPELSAGARVTLELASLGGVLGARIVAVAGPLPSAISGGAPGAAGGLPVMATQAPPGVAPSIGFPVLAESMAQLSQPVSGHTALAALTGSPAHALPGGGANFAAALLTTIGALRRADIAALLGPDGARTLGRATHDALKRELEGAQHDASLDADEPWHGLMLPVLDGGSLGQLALFVRRHAPETDATDPHHPVRFLVEASPSAIGPLQIDGLSHERRLDLIIRSHRALPEAWRDDLRKLYADALAELHLSGGIVYQVMPRFPVSAIAALRASGHPTLTA